MIMEFNMKRLVVILSLVLLLSGWRLLGQEERRISIEEFLEAAAGHSRFSEILIDELSLDYDEALKSRTGPLVLSLLTEYSLTYDRTLLNNLKGGVSLSKLFALSGTTLSGSYSFSPSQSGGGQGSSSFNLKVNSTLSFKVEQEIVKNSFGKSERLKRLLAGNEKELAYYQIVESYENYLALVITLYIDWYALYENLKFTEKAVGESRVLLTNTREMFSYNVATGADLNKSELQLLTRQGQLKELESNYRSFLYRIKELMGIEDEELYLIPAFSLAEGDLIPLADREREEGLESSRTARLYELLIKNRELERKNSLNELLPSLNLYSGYSFSGVGFGFEENSRHSFQLGLELSYALPQPGSFAAYKRDELELEKEQLKSSNSLDSLKESLELLRYNLELEREMIELSERKVRLSESIVKSEEKDYRLGISSLNNLIGQYNSLNSNRLEGINHIVRYYRYYVEYLRLSDRLVNRDKEIELTAGNER